MKINRETDYALRIMRCLARSGSFIDAATIAKTIDVPARFTLKILRKLTQGGLLCSKKGAIGGYALSKPANEITMLDIIELIDGQIAISRCLCGDFVCSHPSDDGCSCAFNHIFDEINELISDKLRGVTLDTVM